MALFSQLGKYHNFGMLVMRAGIGIMMMVHGLPKLSGGIQKWTELGHAMGNLHIHFAPAFWGFMCAATEGIGGLFCILGLWFRPVSILLFFNFVVAALFHFAAGDGVGGAGHALELCAVFFGFIFLGAGTISVDKS